MPVVFASRTAFVLVFSRHEDEVVGSPKAVLIECIDELVNVSPRWNVRYHQSGDASCNLRGVGVLELARGTFAGLTPMLHFGKSKAWVLTSLTKSLATVEAKERAA